MSIGVVGQASATYSISRGLTSAQIATNIANQIDASDPNRTATTGGTNDNEITITLRSGVTETIGISSSDGGWIGDLKQTPTADLCQAIVDQINDTDWWHTDRWRYLPPWTPIPKRGPQVVITAQPGTDGNMVTFYELHSGSGPQFSPSSGQLSGNSSDNVSWHIAMDFTGLDGSPVAVAHVPARWPTVPLTRPRSRKWTSQTGTSPAARGC